MYHLVRSARSCKCGVFRGFRAWFHGMIGGTNLRIYGTAKSASPEKKKAWGAMWWG